MHRAQKIISHLSPAPAADSIIPASLVGKEISNLGVYTCRVNPNHHLVLVWKVAIVTGSGQGIGYSVACQLAELGAKVVISDLDSDKVED